MANIYLDVDGVILANEKNKANYADEFIKHIVTNYTVFWLTTHCHNKENYTIPLLSRFFSEETMVYVRKIRPTEWDVNKTDGIDFSSPFLWFDDDLYEGEKQELVKRNLLDNWIEVNLAKDENQLGKFLASFPIPIQLIK